jgi:rhamnulokinase
MSAPLYIAIDLGAGSGRVFLVGPDAGAFFLQQIRRFHYPPVESAGHLRWELPKIFDEIKQGLRDAAAHARQLGRKIESIGVDSWGVDYALLDADGNLVELPICYRDERTRGVMEQVYAVVPGNEVFERTGIQFMPFNTLFQLFAHAREGVPTQSERLLLIPDAINFFLTGKIMTEYTNATTTQMLSARTGKWDCALLDRIGLPTRLLAEVVPSGAQIGPLRSDLRAELNMESIDVVAPATHDTGSAIAGAPLKEGWAYISSGTWSLVGVERAEVLINSDVARDNFTNEGGAFGTIRFLKNVMGLWLLESCRKEWQSQGNAADYDVLLRELAALSTFESLIFPDDQRFLNPPSMLEAIAAQLSETGQSMPDSPASIAKMILDSLAFRYAAVLTTIELLTNRKIEGVQIIGGGSQNGYLNQTSADVTGLPVAAGPVEATVIGNAMVQAVSHGRFASLTEARRYIAARVPSKSFQPQNVTGLDETRRRYAEIEARYT